METSTDATVTALGSALDYLGTFAVQYSFSVLGAILLVIAGFIVAGWVERRVLSLTGHLRELDITLRQFLAKLARYTVLALVATIVLSQFGVQTASIIAALGAAGLTIGLALQGTLQNVAAGVMLLVLRPFKVGEFVEAGSVTGTVKEIGLFCTELEALDGLFIMAPNGELWNSAVRNYSRNPLRRYDLAIGIAYDNDIEKAMGIYRDLVANDGRVLDEPEPYLFVSSLGDSAVEVTCRYWTATADFWATSRDLTKLAKERFDAAGLSIPFPQRDVHLIGEAAQA